MRVHYTAPYLLNPPHKVTIDLVGLGGTGSQVLTGLARINESLVALNHPGLFVRAWDPDIVTEANVGRQLFSTADINQNKALVLITRVNRYFGYEWQAMPELYNTAMKSNILITCVDTAAARIAIDNGISSANKKTTPTNNLFYWLDFGNLQKTGQVVLGTVQNIKQPEVKESTTASLKTVRDKFPQLATIKEKQQGPSCSLAEALEKQDLFINSTLAQFGCNLLWKLLREGMIRYHGCFLNLENLLVNPIKMN